MNTATRQRITQFHFQFQHELLPFLERDVGEHLNPALQRVVRTLECVEIERFVLAHHQPGCPQRARQALARAFVAKAVLGLSQTRDLIERLTVDKTPNSQSVFQAGQSRYVFPSPACGRGCRRRVRGEEVAFASH